MMKIRSRVLGLLILSLIFSVFSCSEKEDEDNTPTPTTNDETLNEDDKTVSKITTIAVSSVTSTSFTSGGSNITLGNSDAFYVYEKGLVWDTVANPSILKNLGYSEDGTSLEDFQVVVSGLVGEKTYYLKAYISTDDGYIYGEELTVTTSKYEEPTASCTPSKNQVKYGIYDATYYSVLCGINVNDEWEVDGSSIGGGDMRMHFASQPHPGVYKNIGSDSPTFGMASDEVRVTGTLKESSVFSYFYYGSKGATVTVNSTADGSLSFTICEMSFNTASEGADKVVTANLVCSNL